jgi:autotransporter-associated beta strand protein
LHGNSVWDAEANAGAPRCFGRRLKTNNNSRRLNLPMQNKITISAASLLLLVLWSSAQAGSATWDLNPVSGDWNTAANWTPITVPNGSGQTATFALSNTTAVSISATTIVDGITFAPGASAFTITSSPSFFPILTLSGAGITNNSGRIQDFVTPAASQDFAQIVFSNSATAGSSTSFTNSGGSNNFVSQLNGITIFLNMANAGTASFTNKGGFSNNIGSFGGPGGTTEFFDSSSAANSVFTNDGGLATNAGSGHTSFFGNATAANGSFTNNAATVSGAFGGATLFFNNSTAGDATLIANGGLGRGPGGTIYFYDHSTGGTSQVEVFGNGKVDISGHDNSGVTVGSIEGDGNIFLGKRRLTVGSNNLSTTFAGVIQDGNQYGFGDTGGSLIKIGSGTLNLTGANTYTGTTRANGGVLQVDGSITSNVFAQGGTLAGTGTVHGNVTNRFHGTVSPGEAPGTLTTDSYTQGRNGTLQIDIAGPNTGQFSLLDVLGNANLGGVLDPVLTSGFTPTIGEQFIFLTYGSRFGSFFGIQDPTFDNGLEHWSVTYQPTSAILTVKSGPGGPGVTVPDRASTLLLLTLSLLGVLTYRCQLLRRSA